VQKAVAGQPVSAANLDLYYWLGQAHESSGNGAEALAIYGKIQSEDLQFRDVNQRVTRIRSGAPLPVRSPASAPSYAAPAPAAPASAKGPRFAPREEIGRGPLGTVYRAEDAADSRNVALRVLPPDLL